MDLERLRKRGQPELADALVADLERIAGRRLTRKAPNVPVAAVLPNWAAFMDDIVPRYVTALGQPADDAAQSPGNPSISPEPAEPGLDEPSEPVGLASG